MHTSQLGSVRLQSFSSDSIERIRTLADGKKDRLHEFASLLLSFNRKINLISRKSVSDVFDHHVLHSLVIAAFPFPEGSLITDWGAGGGLPSIPLAITLPNAQFIAVDKVEKKTRSAQSMAARLGLSNMDVWNGLAYEYPRRCNYSVSRATAPIDTLWNWHVRVAEDMNPVSDIEWNQGLICLKGGDLASEIEVLKNLEPEIHIDMYDIASVLDPTYYEHKVLVHAYL